jgi:hypothetical protein
MSRNTAHRLPSSPSPSGLSITHISARACMTKGYDLLRGHRFPSPRRGRVRVGVLDQRGFPPTWILPHRGGGKRLCPRQAENHGQLRVPLAAGVIIARSKCCSRHTPQETSSMQVTSREYKVIVDRSLFVKWHSLLGASSRDCSTWTGLGQRRSPKPSTYMGTSNTAMSRTKSF